MCACVFDPSAAGFIHPSTSGANDPLVFSPARCASVLNAGVNVGMGNNFSAPGVSAPTVNKPQPIHDVMWQLLQGERVAVRRVHLPVV